MLGVLGGDRLPTDRLKELVLTADYVVAADSGLIRLLEAGCTPDCVLGDFDSLSEALVGNEALLDEVGAVFADFGQDDTDCAKLLRWASAAGAETITLTCLEGDLLDHTLDALHTCARLGDLYGGAIRLGLTRGFAHVLTAPQESRAFAASPGARVSLIPISGEVSASLQGTKWTLDRQTLSPNGFTSISNESVSDRVVVSLFSGSAFLFIGDR